MELRRLAAVAALILLGPAAFPAGGADAPPAAQAPGSPPAAPSAHEGPAPGPPGALGPGEAPEFPPTPESRQSPPPVAPSEGVPVAETPEAPPSAPPLVLDNVVDRTHAAVERRLDAAVTWFDSFFTERRILEEGLPESFFRLRSGVRFTEGQAAKAITRFHADLRLPAAERKLRLILTGETQADLPGILPEDPNAPGFDAAQAESQVRFQALYELIRRHRTHVNIRAGARFRFPIDSFVKLRFRYALPLSTKALARFTEEGFYTIRQGFGETTQVDLERQFGAPTLLRWSTSGTLAESNVGFLWGSTLSLLRQLTRRTAITLEGGLTGQIRPVAVVTNHLVRARFRQNVFRPWLFYELEPELSWPRVERGVRAPVWAGSVLVEVHFGSREEMRRLREPRPLPPPVPMAPPPPAPGPPLLPERESAVE